MQQLVDNATRTSELARTLRDRGWTAVQIAERFNGSVSIRTVYRWLKGDSGTQREADFEVLEALASQVDTQRVANG